jgi:LysM repeat protein
MPPSWVKLGLGAVALFSDTVLAYAKLGGRLPASPGYQPKNPCPGRCSTAGPNPGNWSLYHNLDQIGSCDQSMFYDFSLLDPVDDPSAFHRIYSCSSYGPDWSNLPNATGKAALGTPINSTYQFGTGNEGGMSPSYVRSLSRQIREYLANGFGVTNNSVILFARAGKTSVGLYIGKGLQNEGTGYFALTSFESAVTSAAQGTGTVAMQLCQPGNDGDHVFGIMATSNSTFEPIQEALQSWSNAECLSFSNTTNITGPAYITTPLVLNLPQAQTTNSTIKTNSTSGSTSKRSSTGRLQRRDTCSYVQVASGDGCYSLSQKCGITQDQLSEYNPSDPNFCSDLQPGEYVCCSEGTLPDFAPQPNADGSCATYTVQSGDYCSAIAAANSITVDELTEYNADTWSWNGCDDLFVGIIICLSTGTPPMPAAVANALCGPTVPGTPTPPAGTNISMLNPCPLNACCDVWGQVSPSSTGATTPCLRPTNECPCSVVLRSNSA